MSEQEAVRRLVKSGPELWAQCSDPLLLSKHLSAFGEIRITRLEPESTVAWEGESASGTVSLETSGWGTRVRLTAVPPSGGAPDVPAPTDGAPHVPAPTDGAGAPHVPASAAPRQPETEPAPQPETEPAPKHAHPVPPLALEPEPAAIPVATARPRRFGALLSSLLNRRRGAAVPQVAVATELEPEPTPVVEPEPAPPNDVVAKPEPTEVECPPEPVTAAVTGALDLAAELEAALDSLGQAHHRPYSRA